MQIRTTYLELFNHPGHTTLPPRDGLTIIHAKRPTVTYYRFLYNTVGNDYNWVGRKKLDDSELDAILQNASLEIHVLFVDGVPAGFAEMEHQDHGEIELRQFGLMPEFIGKGLGKYFLYWTIDKVFEYKPNRFWLHTCTQDHAAALPNYLKSGFKIYKEENNDV